MKDEVTERNSADRFAQLTAFAEGDKKAEKEIFCGYISGLEEFVALLDNATGEELKGTVAHVAHKSLPLMKMTDSAICTMLTGLTRENTEKLTDRELTEDIAKMKEEFGRLIAEMKERI